MNYPMSKESQASHSGEGAQGQPQADHAGAQDAGSAYGSGSIQYALSFLDQVKAQFSEQPEVYNAFLDAMIGFKNGTLDTPMVVSRVCDLFDGYPALIDGFHYFVPAGYRIGTTANPESESNSSMLTTPAGQGESGTQSAFTREAGQKVMSKL
ncbi:paired amphipathic helix [Cubamyces lactineus]|nr:paired amphipathic helix [Cubamyces lactineus]